MAQHELGLADYLRVFQKRKIIILVSVLLMGLFSFLYSGSKIPLYASSTKVKIVERRYTFGGGLATVRSLGDFMETQQQIIRGRSVMERAVRKVGLIEPSMNSQEIDEAINRVQSVVNISRVGLSNVIKIDATTEDPERSRQIAEAIAQSYVEEDLTEKSKEATAGRLFIEGELEKATQHLQEAQQELLALQTQSGGQEEQAQAIRSDLARLDLERENFLLRATPQHPQVILLDEQIAHLKRQLQDLPLEDELRVGSLKREVEDSMGLVTQLKEKYNDAKISESEKVSDVSIVDRAQLGVREVTSNRRVNAVMGALAGLILGLIFAFVRENLDTSIGAIEDVESFLGVPVVGVVPHMGSGKEKKGSRWSKRLISREEKVKELRSRLVVQSGPRSPEAESYQTLRTNIYSLLGEKDHLVLLFTSSGPREGKSITAANFAVASAQMGKKTLLLDADLRRPVVHQIFGLERGPGLFELITGMASYDNVLRNVADILVGDLLNTTETPHYMAYLNLLTAGHLPPNPPELLNSKEMEAILKKFRGDFDLVILDCPPVLPVTDALLLGPKSDGVILVYQTGKTARGALKRTKIQLDTAKAKVMGVVLNDVRAMEMEAGSSYYYRYKKYYSDEIQKEEKK